MNNDSFDSMGLKNDLLHMIARKGYEHPTPIQSQTIPIALRGADIIGQAQTGTGKTAAFGIPILNSVVKGGKTQALIICPTRELAVQVAREIAYLGRSMAIAVIPVYGGQSIDVQLRALRNNPEIIVGTPGRLLDHLSRHTIDLKGLKFAVLDEADEMLDMGFLPDIEKILEKCPVNRQTFLFSATLIREVQDLGKKFMQDPETVLIQTEEKTISKIEQRFYRVSNKNKVETLCRVLDYEQPTVSLIFCRTKRRVDELVNLLNNRGYKSEGLHGDLSQRERDYIMKGFRQGDIKVLIATDIAARGLDIDLVTHVFNYDIPEDPDSYIHRIGRTGRAGRGGVAITLVESSQVRLLRAIERHIDKRIEQAVLPTLAETIEQQEKAIINRLVEISAEPIEKLEVLAEKILAEYDPRAMMAAALKIIVADSPELELTEIDTDFDNTAHIEVPVGKVQGFYPRRMVEFLVERTTLSKKQIGDIEIHSRTSYVEVPMSTADEVYEAFIGYKQERKRQQGFSKNKRKN